MGQAQKLYGYLTLDPDDLVEDLVVVKQGDVHIPLASTDVALLRAVFDHFGVGRAKGFVHPIRLVEFSNPKEIEVIEPS